MEKIITIKGMTCSHCVKRVENSLNNLEGVSAKVNLKDNTAIVKLKNKINDQDLITAVLDAGYLVESIH